MMNDYLFTMLVRQRHEQMIAEVKADRAWQLEWRHKICRIIHILSSFIKDREIPISNQAPPVNERNLA